MIDVIAKGYPRIVRAMRRRHGMAAADTAGLILAAKCGTRAGIWTPHDCDRARRLIASAFFSRPRLRAAR